MVNVSRSLAIAIAIVLLAAGQAAAQFIGYVSPQTVQQTLATNLACTGAAQTFAINNLGQTQHYLNIAAVTSAISFQAEIDGIDRQGNVLRISDILEPPGAGVATSAVSLYGAGYFPQIQVQITCAPAVTATFTASYSGAWATQNNSVGAYQLAQMDKVELSNASATASQSDTFQTPFGSSAGSIFFKYASFATNSTLTVNCGSVNSFGLSGVTVNTILSVTLFGNNGGQVLQVPAFSCPFVKVSYTPGAGGTTFGLEYVFAAPGLGTAANTDPCLSGVYPKTTNPFTAAAAGTTQIIAPNANLSTYVCSYQASQVATAGTVQWVYGTGGACGTGTTSISNAMGVTASTPFSFGGPAYAFKAPALQGICLTTTGAGGTVSGWVTFIQAQFP